MAKRKREFIAAVFCAYLCFCVLYFIFTVILTWMLPSDNLAPFARASIVFQRRKLLHHESETDTNFSTQSNASDAVNCTPPDIEQFPHPLMSYDTRRSGGLIVHIFVSLYLFLGLAIICDEYFVPSLERMCKVFNMQSDVAGATFMAAGSSAPELATAIIAVFVAKDDIGIGTVVGSAVYNIAFVIGICGLFAGREIFLNWWPMFRDCVFYLISILALLFALRDESVTWVESVLFLFLYVVYILFMIVNHRVEKWITQFECFSRFGHQAAKAENGISYHPLPNMSQEFLENGTNEKLLSHSVETLTSMDSVIPSTEEKEESSVFTVPSGGSLRKFFWVASIPYFIFCYFTVPDCRRTRWQNWFFVTFLSSCMWIGILSYILVWMITIIGSTLHIRDTVMGLTFLAAGASIPDAIASLLVVRDGFGDMAVSNAVGSNVFDILICLGLPWFLQTVVVEPGSKIAVRSRGLTYSTLTLLLTVVFLLLATHVNHWKLDKKYGAVLLLWYGLFMVVATIYELNIIGEFDLPTCPTDF